MKAMEMKAGQEPVIEQRRKRIGFVVWGAIPNLYPARDAFGAWGTPTKSIPDRGQIWPERGSLPIRSRPVTDLVRKGSNKICSRPETDLLPASLQPIFTSPRPPFSPG